MLLGNTWVFVLHEIPHTIDNYQRKNDSSGTWLTQNFKCTSYLTKIYQIRTFLNNLTAYKTDGMCVFTVNYFFLILYLETNNTI